MIYSEDEYLQLSGIQHFVFCRRQWALIHIEQQWAENYRTTDGKIMHKNAHNAEFNETRGDKLTIRALPVSSSRLGISGECDVVEFTRRMDGISVFGREGKYSVTPVEYKRGEPKLDDCDTMQLMAQAFCLEEMLCCEISFGYLFYGETKRRQKVEFTSDLRKRTENVISEMHKLYRDRHTPKVKRSKSCNACSIKDICLPVICSNQSASDYIFKMLEESNEKTT